MLSYWEVNIHMKKIWKDAQDSVRKYMWNYLSFS